MNTVEILAGDEFTNAVAGLELTSAKCTFHYDPPAGSFREDYQVWLLSKEDFENLCAVDEDEWREDWGWWRYCVSSNMTSPLHEYIVCGHKIMAWDGFEREHFDENCKHCSDNYNNAHDAYSACLATQADQEKCCKSREYPDIIAYLDEELGLSSEKNVCALTAHLAQINNMTLSELFKKYLGGE